VKRNIGVQKKDHEKRLTISSEHHHRDKRTTGTKYSESRSRGRTNLTRKTVERMKISARKLFYFSAAFPVCPVVLSRAFYAHDLRAGALAALSPHEADNEADHLIVLPTASFAFM
jgi:hypothetical protein